MTEPTDETTTSPQSRTARYRRLVVDRLCEHTTLTVADLADEIAAHEHDTPLTDVPPTAVTEIYLELCEVHLPELASASLVSYHEDRDLVSRPGCGYDASVTVSDARLPSIDEFDSS
jgi:hypothetical protein